MQAKVKADNRFDNVTAGTRVYSKDEWRRVLPEWEDRLPDSYGDYLDFQDERAAGADFIVPPGAAPDLFPIPFTGDSVIITPKVDETPASAAAAKKRAAKGAG
jgi:hypothetical protein